MLFKHNLYYGKFFSPDGEGGGGAGASGDDGGESDAGNNDGAQDGDSSDDGGEDVSALKSALSKERKAARDAAKQLKSIQAELDEIRNAGKPESEKLTTERDAAIKRAEAAETRAREANAKVAVSTAAAQANAIEASAIFPLVSAQLEYNDDDEPTNVDDVLAAAKKSYPRLFKAAAGSGDGGKRTTGEVDVKPGVERLRHAYTTTSKTAARR
jgi:hypothetical protein